MTVFLTAVITKTVRQHDVAEITFFKDKDTIIKIRFVNLGTDAGDSLAQTCVHTLFDIFKAVTGHSD
ncbi:hypothetical protein AXN86_20295 [Salmonella enterica subsp. enterica serovar Anatum]|nr:hypothetical protein [Salmonella enterica subsp. enterica serovar Anatum]